MSKRDDLDNEAIGEMGILGTLVLAGGLFAANLINKSNKKDKLKMQIEEKRAEFDRIERQLSEEEGKIFFKDASKINSLQQRREEVIQEHNKLVEQYEKL